MDMKMPKCCSIFVIMYLRTNNEVIKLARLVISKLIRHKFPIIVKI